MNNGKRVMKYNIIFGIALCCVILFTTCDNADEQSEIHIPVENAYGKISINFVGDEAVLQQTRTVLPSVVFDKYVYSFTKVGEETGEEISPDDNGFFTLELGNYTVEVQAFIGDEEPYTLTATGISTEFSVNPGDNDPVEVILSRVDIAVETGEFSYTIMYPAGTEAELILQKWPELNPVTLTPDTLTEEDGITETLELVAGSYMLTVLISKDELYAGTSEAVHIYPAITTEYIKHFSDEDLLSAIPPTVNDYDISGIDTFIYDGEAKSASITRKINASTGEVTVFYNGKITEPVDKGTYIVTFDVEAVAPDWSAASGLPAGTIVIDYLTPVAGDYVISGIETFTYDGTERTVNITRKEDASPAEEISIFYNGTETVPVNAGEYVVTFNVAAAPYWNAANRLSAGTITINKAAGAVVGAPTMASKTTTSINIDPVPAPDNGQTVEYAIRTSNFVPTTGWQDSTSFTGLNASTTYYIFARTKENTNYNAGVITIGLVTTRYTYTVTANGTLGLETTSLTLTFNVNPGTITASNISLGGRASIGSATISGSGTTRTLSPITLTSTGIGNATVSITHPDIETDLKYVQVYGVITAGLYEETPPNSGSYTPVNLDFTSGPNIVDRSFTYINANPGTYTLVLDSNISVAGHSSTDVSNGTAIRHLKATNAKLTIIGLEEERRINLNSDGRIFTVGRTGDTGIELTLGNNITLVGRSVGSYNYIGHAVHIQNGAIFTMRDNALVIGNSGNSSSGGVYIDVVNNSTFTMQNNTRVSGGVYGGGNITMSGSASVTGGVYDSRGYINMSGNTSVTGGVHDSNHIITMQDNAIITGGVGPAGTYTAISNITIAMSDNTSVTGGLGGTSNSSSSHTITMQNTASMTGNVSVGSNSTFIMRDDASVTGGVTVGSNSTFTMQNNANVTNRSGIGVSVSGSGSEFIMSGRASVSNNSSSGVYITNGTSFTMRDNASVSNNNGRGVSVGLGIGTYTAAAATTFIMQNNASVSGNTAANGGGVYIEKTGTGQAVNTFIMQDNASVSGNTATGTGGGGGVYIANNNNIFEMRGGIISGNNATSSTSNGGGVYVNGTFTMSGGTIYGLDAPSAGLRNTVGGTGAALFVTTSGTATRNGTAITNPGSPVDITIPSGGTGTVTISYHINGGTGTTPTSHTNVTAGSPVTLRAGTGFSRPGYTFSGWNTTSSAVGSVGMGTNYNANSSFTPNGNITLYAKWDIVLTANNWTNGTITSSSGQWFRFTATADTQYIHINFGTLADFNVQVFDSSNTTVGANTRLTGGTRAISRPLTAGQVYYVRVTPYNTSGSGTYQIAFNASTTAPQ